MKNSKAFTLVELMAVIVIISLIALLTFPNIINQIKKTKKSNNKMIEDVVIEQAKKYVHDNPNDFDSDTYFVSIKDLIDNDYVKEELIKNSNDDISEKYVQYDDDKYYITDNAFKRITYIESTGTQYIDTKYLTNANSKFKIEYSVTGYVSAGANTIHAVFGDTTDYKGYQLYNLKISASDTSNFRPGVRMSSDYRVSTLSLKMNTRHIVTLKNGELIYDGTYYEIGNYISPGDYNLFLFVRNNINPSSQRKSILKVYYFSIYEGKNIIRDFIPVLDSKGVACLYDKVEGKFYYNQGTGEFLYG